MKAKPHEIQQPPGTEAEPITSGTPSHESIDGVPDVDWEESRRKLKMFGFKVQLQRASEEFNFRQAHDAGNESAVLYAVALAAITGKKIPKWAAETFVENFFCVRDYQAKSWDDVFGKPHPPRTNFKAIQKWKKLASPVFWRIEELRNQGIPIDQAFEKVASEKLISSSTARDYYYRYLRDYLPF
ncbi:MAG: hypothetical protein Q7W55_09650 [Pseudohongiella sp.]|nr:hypothetical protein [Pseudohongiella sp.]